MKKILSFMMMAVVFSVASVSCNKALDTTQNDEPLVSQDYTFNFTVVAPDATTKAVKNSWSAGDKLSLWFNQSFLQTPDLVLTYNGVNWNTGTLREGVEFIDGNSVVSLYEGFNDLSKYSYEQYKKSDTKKHFSRFANLGGDEILHQNMLLKGFANYSYDAESKTVSASFVGAVGSSYWTYITPVQVVITGLDKSKAGEYTLQCDNLPAVCYFHPSDGEYGMELGAPVAGIPNDDGVAFYFGANLPGEKNFTFTLTDYTGETPVVRVYDAGSKTLATNFGANFKGIKIASSKFAEPTTGILNGHEWVKIGGLKWATMNVGATKVANSPSDCAGDYYAWGSVNTLYSEIIWSGTEASFTWKSGKTSGFVSANREYTNTSNTTLPPANDVANSEWGGSWRMPTTEDFMALYEACGGTGTSMTPTSGGSTSTKAKGVYWCSDYDGVVGVLFCDGTNKVFFPAAGGVSGTSLNNCGSTGGYWSSSLHTSNINRAYSLGFYSGRVYPQNGSDRYLGHPVRPVSD